MQSSESRIRLTNELAFWSNGDVFRIEKRFLSSLPHYINNRNQEENEEKVSHKIEHGKEKPRKRIR